MAVLNALRRTPSALARNLVLFVPILVLVLVQVPQIALQSVNPLLSSVVSLAMTLVFIVVMPFFQGGTIAMAAESLDGRTSLQTFITEGKANYVQILVAYLLLIAVNFVLGIVAFFVGIFGGVVVLGSGGFESVNLLVLGAIAVVVGIVVLLYVLLIFFVQFYGQAIVLDDFDAIDGLKHSASVVRHHLVSTLGYSVLCGSLGGVFGGVAALGSLLLSPRTASVLHLPEPTFSIVVLGGLAVLVLSVLFGGFFSVFSVAFYRALTR